MCPLELCVSLEGDAADSETDGKIQPITTMLMSTKTVQRLTNGEHNNYIYIRADIPCNQANNCQNVRFHFQNKGSAKSSHLKS